MIWVSRWSRCYQSSRSPSRAGGSVVALFLLAFSAIYSPGQDHFAAISRNGDGTWYYHYDLGFEIHTPARARQRRRCPMGATYRTAQLHAEGRTPRKSTRHRARQSSERPSRTVEGQTQVRGSRKTATASPRPPDVPPEDSDDYVAFIGSLGTKNPTSSTA